jgi:hypothetical protein
MAFTLYNIVVTSV